MDESELAADAVKRLDENTLYRRAEADADANPNHVVNYPALIVTAPVEGFLVHTIRNLGNFQAAVVYVATADGRHLRVQVEEL